MYFLKLEHVCIKLRLSGQTCYTLWEMINKVLEMERDHLEVDALYKEKKR